MHPHQYRHRRKAVPIARPEDAIVLAEEPLHGGAPARAPPAQTGELRIRKLIRWPLVRELTGKSRTQAWRDIKAGKFPAPVETGPNSVAWYLDEVQTYVASRPRVTYAPAAA